MKEAKRLVCVMRRWPKAQVEVFVSEEGVGARMDLDQFLKLVLEEIGSPAFVMTTRGLLAKIDIAKEIVFTEMKRQTTRLV